MRQAGLKVDAWPVEEGMPSVDLDLNTTFCDTTTAMHAQLSPD